MLEAFEGLSSSATGVVVMQPDRFDETTGQLEAPSPGATPLRSRAGRVLTERGRAAGRPG